METTTFHWFPDLPAEIRLQIWRETLPSTHGIVANYDWRWFAMGVYDGVDMPVANGRVLRDKRMVQIPVPITLSINGESRAVYEQWLAKEGLEWQHLWGVNSTGISYERDGVDESTVEHPVKKVLARDWDVNRDYVYLGWERKYAFQEWTLEGLETHVSHLDDSHFDFDSQGLRAPFPSSWSTSVSPPPPYTAITQTKHLVVPAFTGYYSTNLMVDILKYRQVEKLYVLWGKLPEMSYASSTSREEYYELDVQPYWRLEPIEVSGEEEDADDEVEMYSYVSKAQGRDPRAGDEADLHIEKGSLSEWMEELWEQLEACAADEVSRSGPGLAKFLEKFEIIPVKLVED